MRAEQIGFGCRGESEAARPEDMYIPLDKKLVELKIFEPKIGETAVAVYTNGLHRFTGKVTRILNRGAYEPLYRLENDKGEYEHAYASCIVRVEDLPDQGVYRAGLGKGLSIYSKN